MKVPFSTEAFLNVFKEYNEAVFPVQILLNGLAVFIIILLLQRNKDRSRAINFMVSILWLWTGIAYHILFFTRINKPAFLFGALFILEALLWFRKGVIHSGIQYARPRPVFRGLAFFLLIYALLIYPLLGYISGHIYPYSPTFGAPCPVVIFTFGLTLMARRIPGYLLIIPMVWSIIGLSAVLNFGILEDVMLFISGTFSATILFFYPGARFDKTISVAE